MVIDHSVHSKESEKSNESVQKFFFYLHFQRGKNLNMIFMVYVNVFSSWNSLFILNISIMLVKIYIFEICKHR